MEKCCSCVKGADAFDFRILEQNSDFIVFQDFSDWMTEDYYFVPEVYNIEVIPPGQRKARPVAVGTKGITKITKKQLGGIVDGVYCFIFTNCGKEYKRSVAVFPSVSCCLRKAFATLPDKISELKEIQTHLDMANNDVSFGNSFSAEKNIKIAKKKLNNIKCDCNGCE